MTDELPPCRCEAYHREHGFHASRCPRFDPAVLDEPHAEFRAVFSYPPSILGETPDTFGPWRRTLGEAARDRSGSPEEDHGWRSGFQHRLVYSQRALRVHIELDAMSLLSVTTEMAEREDLRTIHGLWLDPDSLQQGFAYGPLAKYTAVRTGKIVYREDGAPAEVYEVKRDWNQR